MDRQKVENWHPRRNSPEPFSLGILTSDLTVADLVS
jgi:hypothetical protein